MGEGVFHQAGGLDNAVLLVTCIDDLYKTLMIFSAILTFYSRVLLSEMVEFPNQPVRQLMRTPTIVSFVKVVRMECGKFDFLILCKN